MTSNNNWLLIGGAALLAYLYLTKDANATPGSGGGGGDYYGGIPNAPTSVTPGADSSGRQGNQNAIVSTAGDLLKLIKNSVSTFDQVQGSGIFAVTPALKTSAGISKVYADPNLLASNTGLFSITVSKTAKDSVGLSSIDKMILKNKGLTATAANAKKAGLR